MLSIGTWFVWYHTWNFLGSKGDIINNYIITEAFDTEENGEYLVTNAAIKIDKESFLILKSNICFLKAVPKLIDLAERKLLISKKDLRVPQISAIFFKCSLDVIFFDNLILHEDFQPLSGDTVKAVTTNMNELNSANSIDIVHTDCLNFISTIGRNDNDLEIRGNVTGRLSDVYLTGINQDGLIDFIDNIDWNKVENILPEL